MSAYEVVHAHEVVPGDLIRIDTRPHAAKLLVLEVQERRSVSDPIRLTLAIDSRSLDIATTTLSPEDGVALYPPLKDVVPT